MVLTLYTNPMSRGRVARWMLEEVGAPYETVLLDYASSMKGDAYLTINPMGKVPAIVHDGRVVTETAAICAYLADAFPDAALAPPSEARADYYRWLFFAAGPLEAAVVERARGIAVTPEQSRMVGYGTFDQAIRSAVAAVDGREFVAGDRFSAADVYFGSQVMWFTQFGIVPPNPVFERYLTGLASRPAYRRARDIDEAAAQPA